MASLAHGGHPRLMLGGDSNVAGAGGGSGGPYLYQNAYAASLASALQSDSVKFSHGCLIGGQNVDPTVPYSQYDPRVVFSGGTTFFTSGGYGGMGGDCFTGTSGQAGSLVFTPAEQFDRVEVIYITASGNGNIAVVAGGATIATIAGNAATATATTGPLTCPLTSSVTLNWDNGGGLPNAAILTWNSAIPSIIVMHGGWAGGTIAQAANTANPYSAGSQIPLFNADLWLVNGLTINDASLGTNPAAWAASMQTLINLIRSAGSDVAWVTGLNLENAAPPSPANDLLLNAQLRAVAQQNDVAVLEMHEQWRPIAAYASNFYYTFDNRHPSAAGHADWGSKLAQFVLALG